MRKRNVLLILCLALFFDSKIHAQSRTTARIHSNIIHTYAGGGPDGIAPLSANIPEPTAVATDTAGNIYIAAPGGDRVFVVDTSGKIRVAAGSGVEATTTMTPGTIRPFLISHSPSSLILLPDLTFGRCALEIRNKVFWNGPKLTASGIPNL